MGIEEEANCKSQKRRDGRQMERRNCSALASELVSLSATDYAALDNAVHDCKRVNGTRAAAILY